MTVAPLAAPASSPAFLAPRRPSALGERSIRRRHPAGRLSDPLVSPSPRLRSGLRSSGAALHGRHGIPTLPVALAALLVGLAVLVAPEQPRDQEAICHRQAGVEACRVW